MQKNTVVLITEELPLPHNSGYSTYNHAFLSALLLNGYQVHLVITGNRFPAAYFNAAKRLNLKRVTIHIPQAISLFGNWYIAKPLGVLKIIYRRCIGIFKGLRKWIDRSMQFEKSVIIGRWLNQKDLQQLRPILQNISPQLILIDTLFRSPVLTIVDANCSKFLIGHDVFSQRCLSLANNGFQPRPWINAEDEASVLQQFDAVFAITESDAAEYQHLSTQCQVRTLSSPVMPIIKESVRTKTGRIFYLGSQAHHNIDGLEWYLAEVWPLVLQENPTLWLDVVGSIGACISHQHPNVSIHGRLDNFSALAEQAMFAINPVRAGSGMKIKILDYLAHGLACVTTSVGIAGFPDQPDRPITACDDAESFAHTLLAWARDEHYCSMLSTLALDYVKQFSSDEFNARLQNVLMESLCDEGLTE